jgi:hypothetical protein
MLSSSCASITGLKTFRAVDPGHVNWQRNVFEADGVYFTIQPRREKPPAPALPLNIIECYSMTLLFAILIAGGFVIGPVALVWSWLRLFRNRNAIPNFPVLSFLSLLCTTASALLAIGSTIYAHHVGGFGFYDPRLLRIYRCGFYLSLGAILLSLIGIFQRSPIRWLPIGAGIDSLFFWFCMASGE